MLDHPEPHANSQGQEQQRPPQVSRRRQVRLACDVCRRRKTRCDLEIDPTRNGGVADENTAAVKDVTDSTTSSLIPGPCRRCRGLGIPCTFLLPTRPRGPKKGSAALSRRTVTSFGPSPPSPHLDSASPRSHSWDNGSRGAPSTESQSPLNQPPPDQQCDAISPGLWASGVSAAHDELTPSSRSPDITHFRVPGYSSPTASNAASCFPTDGLCARPLFNIILQDYIDFIYPSVPLVHRPSFKRDVSRNRDMTDTNFLALTLSLCALVVATMRDKFDKYRSHRTPLRFRSRTDMVHCCHKMIIGLRGMDYYDQINLQKWATSYSLTIAYFQVGRYNQERMLEVESMQLARLLDLHNPSSYVNLSCIETQLRKKAFWLMFYAYVHSQLQNVHKEKLTFLDALLLRNITLHSLMPSDVDDEYILEDHILPQPASRKCLTTAFIYHSLTFWASIKSTAHRNDDPPQLGLDCMETGSVQDKLTFLAQRLSDLKYILDDVPDHLRPWAVHEDEHAAHLINEENLLKHAQLEALRADLHVTHLWLQSVIMEQMESLKAFPSSEEAISPVVWEQRENLCRQILFVLLGLPRETLGPIGNHLTHKLRDVAITLLPVGLDPDEHIAKRRAHYLRYLASLIASVDGNDGTLATLSLQSWTDTRC